MLPGFFTMLQAAWWRSASLLASSKTYKERREIRVQEWQHVLISDPNITLDSLFFLLSLFKTAVIIQ